MSTLTVSQLNRQIRSWLELDMGEVSVVGELSNLSKPASGHYYFTLKDTAAQVRCVFFRNHHTPDTRQFRDGQQVIARGKLSLYEARGDYQLIVQELTDHGLGELYRQFEWLKTRLQQQGLFDPARKKPFPPFPIQLPSSPPPVVPPCRIFWLRWPDVTPLPGCWCIVARFRAKGLQPS